MAYLATVAAFGFADIPTQEMLTIFRGLGCTACQFYRNEKNPPKPADARKMAEDHGLPIDSIHGVFGAKYDPSSPDAGVRRAAVETYRSEGRLAKELGGPMVVVHPAPLMSEMFDATQALHKLRVDPMKRTIEDLAKIGDELGVTYLMENLPGTFCFGSNPAELAGMVRELKHPRVRMCFDTGHAHMTGPVAEAMTASLDVIAYLHVHDNDGGHDSHEFPGRGTIVWEKLTPLVKKLDAQMPAMLELFQNAAEFRAEIGTGMASRLKKWLALN